MIFLSLLFIEIQAFNGISCLCSELSLEQECQYAGCEWITNTNQCINRLPINQPNCSDYEDQLVCDFLQGCAWNNQGKCEQFTQCSDYVIDLNDTSDQCYLKDQTCRNGQINNQGFITCQSIDQLCSDYVEELFIIEYNNQSQMITQVDSNQTTIQDIKQNIIENCLIQQTLFRDCSMITNEIICQFVKNQYQTTICQWINNSCIQSNNTNQLNQEQCYLNTGGTHSWQNNKCQMCKEKTNQNFNQNRILAETSKFPTFTTSTSNKKSSLITYSIDQQDGHYDKNCTHIGYTTISNNCFNNDCKEVKIEKDKQSCSTYKSKIYLTYDQNDKICTTVSKIFTNQNGSIFTETNSTNVCLQTSNTVEYTNGSIKNVINDKNNNTITCQQQQFMYSQTDGNSVKQCTQVFYGSTVFEDTCQIIQEDKFTPDDADLNQPQTTTTISSQCERKYFQGSLIHIEHQNFEQKIQTSKKLERNIFQVVLDTGNSVAEHEHKENTTIETTITNKTNQYENKTIIYRKKKSYEVIYNNTPETRYKETFSDNETNIVETYTYNASLIKTP